MRPLGILLSLLALGAVPLCAADPGEASSVPAPVYSRQRHFSIPFRIDEPDVAAASPVEIQLHVSDDLGVTWHPSEKVSPEQRNFIFRASREGEYWFMVRTLDRAGRLLPKGPPAAELRVIVDTIEPVVELVAERGEAGEIKARWRIVDQNLRPDSLKIDYQPIDVAEARQQVATDALQIVRPGDPVTGDAVWWPEVKTGIITVRAEVTDLAGNRGVSQMRVEPTWRAANPPATPPIASSTGSLPLPPPVDQPGLSAPRSSVPAQEVSVPLEARTEQVATRWPSERSRNSPFGAPPPLAAPSRRGEVVATPRPESMPSGEFVPAPPADRFPGGAAPWNRSVSNPGSGQPGELIPPGTVDGQAPRIQPAATPLYSPAEVIGNGGMGAYPSDLLPPGIRPRMVNSRRFELEYDIESVGPEGISKVELWGTLDGGRTWANYGVDNDNRSPWPVAVDREGLYGFRIVVETGVGLRGTPPASGDLPDVWVGVDLSQPAAEIVSVQQGQAEHSGELDIHWQAEDQLLASRPVSLSFAEVAVGPWSTIAAGLENTGRYLWRFDNRVPDKFFLRLEVRDEAGNVQTVIAPKPVVLDRIRPSGRIRSVRPMNPAG